MATGLGDLVLKLGLDDSQYNSNLKRAEQSASKTGNSISSAFQKGTASVGRTFTGLGNAATGTFGRIQQGASKAGKSISDMGASGATAIAALGGGAAFLALGKSIFTAAANVQQLEVAFGTFLGSAQKGKQVLLDLTNFAASTPFEIPEIRKAGQALLAFGVESNKLIPSLKAIGDVSSGVSAPISEIATLYGKARTQGRLFGEDINQLTGRGIPIIQELARQFNVSEGEVKKLVEQGKVGFPQLEQAFITMSSEGGRFYNLMEKQSQTLGGQTSALADKFTVLKENIGLALVPQFTATVTALNTAFETLGPLVSAVATAFQGLEPAHQQLIIFAATVGTVTIAVSALVAAVSLALPIVAGLGAAFTGLLLPVGAAVLAIGTLVAAINNWDAITKTLQATWNNFLDAVRRADQTFINFNTSIRSNIIAMLQRALQTANSFKTGIISYLKGVISGGLQPLGNAAKSLQNTWSNSFNTARNTVTSFATGAGNAFTFVLNKARGVFQPIINWLRDITKLINPVVQGIQGIGDKLGGIAGAVGSGISAATNAVTEGVNGVNSVEFGTAPGGGLNPGVSLSGLTGPNRAIAEKAIAAGYIITSTTGGKHAKGSNHYIGRAVDISSPGNDPVKNLRLAQQLAKNPKGIRELFHDPLGYYIKNGQVIPGSIGGHGSHVHISFNKGGVVPGTGNKDTVPAMLTPGEIVLPKGISKQFLDAGGKFNPSGLKFYNKGTLTQGQIQNVKVIIREGQRLGASPRDIQIALMTALQESGIRNLSGGHGTSTGIFQQTSGNGWGSAADRVNPTKSAQMFYQGSGSNKGLLDISNRGSKRMGDLAQSVQRSAYPRAYDKWESTAKSLYNQYAETVTKGSAKVAKAEEQGAADIETAAEKKARLAKEQQDRYLKLGVTTQEQLAEFHDRVKEQDLHNVAERAKIADKEEELLKQLDEARAEHVKRNANITDAYNNTVLEAMALEQSGLEAQGDVFGAARVGTDIALARQQLETNKEVAALYDQLNEALTHRNYLISQGLTAEAARADQTVTNIRGIINVTKELNGVKLDQIEGEYESLVSAARTAELREAVSTVSSSMQDALSNILKGTQSVGQALLGMLGSIADKFLDIGLNSIFSGSGTKTGGILGFLGSLVGIQKFATGGVVTKPTVGLIGEGKYNEAVVPMPSGKSIPVDLRGAGKGQGGVTFGNIVVNVNGGQGDGVDGRKIGLAVKASITEQILREKRPGGLLYA